MQKIISLERVLVEISCKNIKSNNFEYWNMNFHKRKCHILFSFLPFLVILAVHGQQQNSSSRVAVRQSDRLTTAAMTAENYVMDHNEHFCYYNPRRPFYQRASDGAICCQGKQLPYVTIAPEITGECAISTTTDANGILNSPPLWCAYSCSLKKMGLVDNNDQVIPDKFFAHLTNGLSNLTQVRLKAVMEQYLDCYKPLKNPKFPCYSALGFHKCYRDALQFVCSIQMPSNNDFSKLNKTKIEYENLTPMCHYNKRRVMPGCCHGRPLPWSITEILEVPRNATKKKMCISNMGNQCDGTCYMNSVNAVNEALELDVDSFAKTFLQFFPTVQPSSWMYFSGPTFLFYDELIGDVDGFEDGDSTRRVCMFHDQILELHANKVEQYCNMSPDQVKELVKSNAADNAKNSQ